MAASVPRLLQASRVAVRSYATDAAKIVPPLQLASLSGKYATAAFCAALRQSSQALTQLEQELKSVQTAVEKDGKLKSFLENPTLTAKQKEQGLQNLLSTAKATGPVTKNLFEVLSSNGRLTEYEKVFADFFELVAAHKGEVKITITSAAPLDSSTQSRLERALKESQTAKTAKVVKFENRVNPSVLGGFIVDFGDKSIDLTVQSRVQRLNSALQASV